MKITTLDVTALSVGGINQLAFFESAQLSVDFDLEDGSSGAIAGVSKCITKKGGKLSLGLFSNSANACRVSNLDVSALTLGGTDIIGLCRSGTITVDISHSEGSGSADVFKYPEPVDMELKSNVMLVLPTDSNFLFGVGGFVKSILSDDPADIADLHLTLALTLNSAQFTIPFVVGSFNHTANRGSLQEYSLSLEASAPSSGDYPVAPTGTTTIIEKCINAFRTPVACVFTAGPDSGAYTGNFVFESLSFSWEDSSLIKTNVELASYGPITEGSS